MKEESKPYGSRQEWYDAPPREPHSMRLWLVGAMTAAVLALIAAMIAGKVKAQPTIALPFATSTNVGTTSAQIIPASPSRRSIQICNPSTTAANFCVVAPLGITPTNSATVPVGVAITAGTCFAPPANVMNSGTGGGAGAGWNGICAAANQTLMVLEW